MSYRTDVRPCPLRCVWVYLTHIQRYRGGEDVTHLEGSSPHVEECPRRLADRPALAVPRSGGSPRLPQGEAGRGLAGPLAAQSGLPASASRHGERLLEGGHPRLPCGWEEGARARGESSRGR